MARARNSEQVKIDQITQHLHTSVIGDILDGMGQYHQFLPPEIRPLREGPPLVGRTMPVLIDDEYGPPERAFGRLTHALDDLTTGEVYIARGGRIDCAAWGEIMTTVARERGASGAVIDGYHRDTLRVRAHRWPVFSRGSYGQDAGVRASVRDFRVPIEIGGVRIAPGDLVVGDVDGVVLIPQTIEDEVIERSLAKVRAESTVLAAISAGMSSTEAYTTYGVL
jgi:regulator of RNase E activity RraA